MRILAAIFFLFISAVSAQADLKACKALYANAPRSLGDYVRSEGKNYEKDEPGLGYAMQYGRTNGNRATVFFYDVRKQRITERVFSKQSVQSNKDLLRVKLLDWAKRGVGELESNKSEIFIDEPKGFGGSYSLEIKAYLRAVGIPHDGEYLLMGVVNNCIIKLRFTTPGSRAKTDKKYEKIKRDLARYLNR